MDVRKNKKELLSPEIILNAVAGEEQAIREVLEFYEKQIYTKFQCVVTDSFLYQNGYTKPITDKLDEMGIQHTTFWGR